ncbi:MAG: tetratricopeptide repeat protein [bacterium]
MNYKKFWLCFTLVSLLVIFSVPFSLSNAAPPINKELLTRYLQEKKYDQALKEVQSSLKRDNNPESHYWLAVVYSLKNELNSSITELEQALKLNSNFFEAYGLLGDIFHSEGKYLDAIKTYQKVISLNPNSSEIYSRLGDSYYENGDIEKAIENFRTAITLDDQNLQAYMILGRIYIEKGSFNFAIDTFQKVITSSISAQNNPYLPQAHYNIANAYYYKLDLEEAWKHAHLAKKYGLDISSLAKKLKNWEKKKQEAERMRR